jgi:hypothetical protein
MKYDKQSIIEITLSLATLALDPCLYYLLSMTGID